MKLIKYFETHFIACVALAGLDQIPLYAYKWSKNRPLPDSIVKCGSQTGSNNSATN